MSTQRSIVQNGNTTASIFFAEGVFHAGVGEVQGGEIEKKPSSNKVEFCSVCGNVGHNASDSCCPYRAIDFQ
ncbi:MAG: hypothetical protein Q7S11_02110 [bacterium]|nr:hypothetical protein [bacterium]